MDYYAPSTKFQRGGVEHIPVEALQYTSEVQEEEEDSDHVAFSRSAVESYPRFPTPYAGGKEDEVSTGIKWVGRIYNFSLSK